MTEAEAKRKLKEMLLGLGVQDEQERSSSRVKREA